MENRCISRATLGRLPDYLQYLRNLSHNDEYISASKIARALDLGDVLVRKDLGMICDAGKPKLGFLRSQLISDLEDALGASEPNRAVIVGAGKLGQALLAFDGFSEFGLEIVAAFDSDAAKCRKTDNGKPVLPMDELQDFCRKQNIRIGIITVPKNHAQSVCNAMIRSNIKAIWNFAPVELNVPEGIIVQYENLALSLAYLKTQYRPHN